MGCRRREALIRGQRSGAWEGWTPSEKVSATKQNLKKDAGLVVDWPGVEFIMLEHLGRIVRES